jgi:hypothetical protein
VSEAASGKIAAAAVAALASSRFRARFQAQAAAIVGRKRDAVLQAAFEKSFAAE